MHQAKIYETFHRTFCHCRFSRHPLSCLYSQHGRSRLAKKRYFMTGWRDKMEKLDLSNFKYKKKLCIIKLYFVYPWTLEKWQDPLSERNNGWTPELSPWLSLRAISASSFCSFSPISFPELEPLEARRIEKEMSGEVTSLLESFVIAGIVGPNVFYHWHNTVFCYAFTQLVSRINYHDGRRVLQAHQH